MSDGGVYTGAVISAVIYCSNKCLGEIVWLRMAMMYIGDIVVGIMKGL